MAHAIARAAGRDPTNVPPGLLLSVLLDAHPLVPRRGWVMLGRRALRENVAFVATIAQSANANAMIQGLHNTRGSAPAVAEAVATVSLAIRSAEIAYSPLVARAAAAACWPEITRRTGRVGDAAWAACIRVPARRRRPACVRKRAPAARATDGGRPACCTRPRRARGPGPLQHTAHSRPCDHGYGGAADRPRGAGNRTRSGSSPDGTRATLGYPPRRARRRRDRAADRERIRVRHLDDVARIILPMIATVAVIEAISGRIRRRLVGTAQ